MYHVVIADDEQLERMALRQSVSEQFGERCGRIALAANGREAVEAVCSLHADIAILDIEMPGMGGIEASRLIREREPNCRIIFLTAYSEFSYARQAVEVGAADYLLKPCPDHELKEVLERVAQQVESRRTAEMQQEFSSSKIEKLTQKLEEQIVLTVMGGYLRADHIDSQLRELNVAFCNGAFAILSSPDGVSSSRILRLVRGCGWQSGLHLMPYEYDDRLYLLAISSHAEKDCAHLLSTRLGELSDQQLTLSRRRLYCAVGERFDRLEDAQESFYQAQAAIARCSEKQRVCASGSGPQGVDGGHEADGFSASLCQKILEGEEQAARQALQTLIQGLRVQQLDHRTAADRLEKELRRLFDCLRQEGGLDPARKYDLPAYLAGAHDLDGLEQFAGRMIGELVRDAGSGRGGRMGQIMQEIADYIGSNYQRDIFLQQVAQEMNYSDAYFSKLFKQCFNKNFVTYLTEVRVEAAKELLRNPMVNIKEIGAQVGYKDSNYFTKVFRRATGKSPSEYREGVMGGETAQNKEE